MSDLAKRSQHEPLLPSQIRDLARSTVTQELIQQFGDIAAGKEMNRTITQGKGKSQRFYKVATIPSVTERIAALNAILKMAFSNKYEIHLDDKTAVMMVVEIASQHMEPEQFEGFIAALEAKMVEMVDNAG
jgi:hypothetical protein